MLSAAKEEVLIADGKSRPIERPKRKNLRHIAVTNKMLDEESMQTNKKLKNTLKKWRTENYICQHE